VFTDAQHWGCQNGYRGVSILVASLASVAIAGLGCCCGPDHTTWDTCNYRWKERGFANQCKTQILFRAPPGASVTVVDPVRTHQIAADPAFGSRLEHTPDEESIFNLAPGRYDFKYTGIEGMPGVSVYGELEVKFANSRMARKFQRLAFVPIALPSEYYRHVEVVGDELYPYRGEAYRTAIDENDITRLRLGDVVEKVFVVADLKAAEQRRLRLEREIAVTERELEYADAKFRSAYLDFRVDVDDDCECPLFGSKSKDFIKWQERQVKLQQKLDCLERRLRQTQALLRAHTICVRDGLLLVATCELLDSFQDPEDGAECIGEVLVVMRLGGRHKHWGEPGRELAGYQPAE
jgi:hypothetical protein